MLILRSRKNTKVCGGVIQPLALIKTLIVFPREGVGSIGWSGGGWLVIRSLSKLLSFVYTITPCHQITGTQPLNGGRWWVSKLPPSLPSGFRQLSAFMRRGRGCCTCSDTKGKSFLWMKKLLSEKGGKKLLPAENIWGSSNRRLF